MKENFKSGFVTIIGRPKRWKINFNESSDWSEDRNHIQ